MRFCRMLGAPLLAALWQGAGANGTLTERHGFIRGNKAITSPQVFGKGPGRYERINPGFRLAEHQRFVSGLAFRRAISVIS